MCGILGMYTNRAGKFYKTNTDAFANMMVLTSFRGMDSAGMAGADLSSQNKEVSLIKHIGNVFNLLQWEKTSEFLKLAFQEQNALIGHCRAKTIGDVVAKNAHPFLEENITLVHNGTISNFGELKKKYEINADVDSQALAILFNKFEPKDIMKEVMGAYALLWFDTRDNSFNVLRNSQRPLFVGKTKAYQGSLPVYLYASEKETLIWAGLREKFEYESLEEVPINKHIKFVNGTPLEVDVPPYVVPYTSLSYQHDDWQGYYGRGNAIDITRNNSNVYYSLKDEIDGNKLKEGDKIELLISDYEERQNFTELILEHPFLEKGTQDFYYFNGTVFGKKHDSLLLNPNTKVVCEISRLFKTEVTTHSHKKHKYYSVRNLKFMDITDTRKDITPIKYWKADGSIVVQNRNTKYIRGMADKCACEWCQTPLVGVLDEDLTNLTVLCNEMRPVNQPEIKETGEGLLCESCMESMNENFPLMC